jgi:phenylalanyl-tRNA synthetase beta chain
LLESAVFNEVSIRKTSKKYDYEKEASKRFERGIDYNNVIHAMDKFTKLLIDIAGGDASGDFVDVKAKNNDAKKIKFDIKNCNKFLGISLDANEYKDIFSKLSIDTDIDFVCTIPSYRNDLEREIDLYEEVARVFGYNNIPISNSFNNSYLTIIENSENIKDQIRNMCCSRGFYEHYSNSLYSDKVLNDFNAFETSQIINESSQDMKYMRNSLIPGLLKAVSFNEKRGQGYFKLFEIGRVHSLIKSYNKEEDNMGFIWYGENKEHWNSKFIADVFYAKGEILSLLNQLKVIDVCFKVEESDFSETNINIYSKKICIGFLRLLDSKLKEKYDIQGLVAVSEISIDKIRKNIVKDSQYKNISSFPSVNRDISILINKEMKSSDIIDCIYNSCDKLLINANVFDVYSGQELDEDSKSLAISLTFQSDEKTLIDKEVDDRLSVIVSQIKTKFNATQR